MMKVLALVATLVSATAAAGSAGVDVMKCQAAYAKYDGEVCDGLVVLAKCFATVRLLSSLCLKQRLTTRILSEGGGGAWY
jgi:hypothetical protein